MVGFVVNGSWGVMGIAARETPVPRGGSEKDPARTWAVPGRKSKALTNPQAVAAFRHQASKVPCTIHLYGMAFKLLRGNSDPRF